jgi:hypothetical protein
LLISFFVKDVIKKKENWFSQYKKAMLDYEKNFFFIQKEKKTRLSPTKQKN